MSRTANRTLQTLSELPPESDEFCASAVMYFRKKWRTQRSCGRFFIVLATLSWGLLLVHWGNVWLVLSQILGFLFAAAIGWVVNIAANKMLQGLALVEAATDPQERYARLCDVVREDQNDPVALQILADRAREEESK